VLQFEVYSINYFAPCRSSIVSSIALQHRYIIHPRPEKGEVLILEKYYWPPKQTIDAGGKNRFVASQPTTHKSSLTENMITY
jgi:hypothetical protein